jgi:hypothetical protein
VSRRYPAGAPVFRLVMGGNLVAAGAIVEGVDLERRPGAPSCGIGVRLLAGDAIGTIGPENRHPIDGWIGFTVSLSCLEPLTPAAREMAEARMLAEAEWLLAQLFPPAPRKAFT